jgi:chemotaxis regulatin CheY-phosphate phosphatase CheZ
MPDSAQIPEAEYLQIEEFIARTPRGRAFLREHTLRAQTGIAAEVRTLVAELRDLWRQQSEATNLANRISVLRHELQDMGASISHARREIAAIKPVGDAGKDRILSATNELDAILVSTEHASSEILGAAERIVEALGRLRGGARPADAAVDEIEAEVMTIFTACSFQDLTGQRTTKVINVLRYIEQRIGALIELWGVASDDAAGAPAERTDRRPDAHLLNGPSADGIDQDAVDRLMSGRPAATVPAAPVSQVSAAPASPAPASGASAPGAPAAAGGGPAAPVAGQDGVPALDQSAVDALFG